MFPKLVISTHALQICRLPIFVYGIAWQVDLVVPIDASPALIQLDLIEKTSHVAEGVITREVHVLLHVIDHLLAVVEGDVKQEVR